jgi:hypothetical protein
MLSCPADGPLALPPCVLVRRNRQAGNMLLSAIISKSDPLSYVTLSEFLKNFVVHAARATFDPWIKQSIKKLEVEKDVRLSPRDPLSMPDFLPWRHVVVGVGGLPPFDGPTFSCGVCKGLMVHARRCTCMFEQRGRYRTSQGTGGPQSRVLGVSQVKM